MCCHTRPARQRLLGALRVADPALGDVTDEQFWHSAYGEALTSSRDDLEQALDRVWTTITTSDRYLALDRERQVHAQQEWAYSRQEALDNPDTLGVAAIDALQRYEDSILRRERNGERKSTVKRVLTTALIGSALLSIGVMAGSTQPRSANAETLFDRSEVSQSQQVTTPATDLDGMQFRVTTDKGGTTTYVLKAPIKGRCEAGAVKQTIKKAHTVTNWQTKSGRITSKALKQGQKVCRVSTAAAGQNTGGAATNSTYPAAPTNAAGQVTGLPSGFPTKPTAQDYAKLGWAWDTPATPSFLAPQPASPIAPARTADRLAVDRVVDAERTSDGGWRVTAEFTLTGGSGVVTFGGYAAPVTLNPNGTVTFTRTVVMPDKGSPYMAQFGGMLEPDYGQAHLPSSSTVLWSSQREGTQQVAQNADGNKGTGMQGSFAYRYDPATNSVIVYR